MAVDYGSIILVYMEETRYGKYTRNGFICSFMRAFVCRFIIYCHLKEPRSPTFYLKYFGALFKQRNEGDF